MAIVTQHELPPQEPLQAHDGTSYVIAWSLASQCWKESPAERISALEARKLLPVKELASTLVVTPEELARLTRCGTGFFSVVYSLEHHELGKVAMKCLQDEGSQSYISERRRVRNSDSTVTVEHI